MLTFAAEMIGARVGFRETVVFRCLRPAPGMEPDIETRVSGQMADREENLQREKRRSPLSDREIEEADERSSTTAKVVHEAIRLEGTEELERPSSSIGWSGLAAGLTMGCSMLGEGILQARLPGTPWSGLVASFGYCLGFIFVTMGRQQLFTETTLTVMLPVLHKTHGPGDVARYWAIVFGANIVATILFAAAAS